MPLHPRSPYEYSSRNLIPNQTLRSTKSRVHRRRFIASSMRLSQRISFKLFSESSHVVHPFSRESTEDNIYCIVYTYTLNTLCIYIYNIYYNLLYMELGPAVLAHDV